ncbi:hypothetical protein B7R22_17090 [Subtercola boreus]|uniref:3'-5' exoribonuclease Rv2179c-like domain-containing protein n=1 Tax=Subtercola boreus TaxID=120213 RepID=A0A3E0VR90_9MICO|nr:3'-5' exoribonuclease [Subtercola boreus]RFA12145.1 hypothetical protein B7R22_17090 [Subtercola boreus]
MKYFYDTEFLEDGRTVDLISIGIVREDGATYYAVSTDANWKAITADPWLQANVIPHLGYRSPDQRIGEQAAHWKSRQQIALEVHAFLTEHGEPELWAWYAAYDHVVLSQLWGRMIDLPAGLPMFTNDLKQVVGTKGLPGLPEQTADEHNALADAQHLKRMHDYVFSAAVRTDIVSEDAGSSIWQVIATARESDVSTNEIVARIIREGWRPRA